MVSSAWLRNSASVENEAARRSRGTLASRQAQNPTPINERRRDVREKLRRMDLAVQRARRMSPLRGDGGAETLHVLAHVRQDDTPEHDIRRPWAPTEREDGTRPILVSHPSDHGPKTVPTRLDLLGGRLFGHGAVLAGVDGIDRMGRLPLEIERLFPGERPGDEAGLPSTPEGAARDRSGGDDPTAPVDRGSPRDGAPAGGRGVPVA